MQGRRKYIFVTGGVMSGLGKGVITASVTKLLRASGLNALPMKIDPYINVDAGTMNPIVHGEVYVTKDGGECDMDLGTYERFLGVDLTREHNITTGQVYRAVIEAERRGDYLGECVQIIPHVTNEIKRRIRSLAEAENLDVLVVESGGTVGDIEGLPYLEAFRQLRIEEGRENTMFLHVTWGPVLPSVGEFKTKPTQHSVQELRRIGIQPDVLVVRSSSPMPDEARRKIALYANVEYDAVFSSPDLDTIYEVPLVLAEQGFLRVAERYLGLGRLSADLESWRRVVEPFKVKDPQIRIAMVGKYSKLADSYVSVNHAIAHAAARLRVGVKIDWLDSERYEANPGSLAELDSYDGVVIPGGFGKRGSEGMIEAIEHARRGSIPFLGICFGFQLATVSFARHVAGLSGANSTELDPSTPHPVVDLLPEQRDLEELGGTMRLGAHEIDIVPGTAAHRIYGTERVLRRHRHRYEVNPEYLGKLQESGLVYSAFSDSGRRAEVLELPGHPFFMATQYHLEFSSRPWEPEPLFLAFMSAALARHREASRALTVAR
ncbi:MAG: CTP synthase [Conexivisphaera sp.]